VDSGNIITTIAEIAVTLIGFSAIVVVLNPQPFQDWGAIEKLNFRILLQIAGITTLFSILPFGTHVIFDHAEALKKCATHLRFASRTGYLIVSP